MSEICPFCGDNEYNPNFPMCYDCSMQQNKDLDRWVERLQIETGMREDKPW